MTKFPVTLWSSICYVAACLIACYLIRSSSELDAVYQRKFRLRTLTPKIEKYYMMSEKGALNENKNEQNCCLFIKKEIRALSWLGSPFILTDDLPVQ